MFNYALMYKEFDDQRLIELSRNCYVILKENIDTKESRSTTAIKGMYACEELKNRWYHDTVQDLIAEIAEQEGLFLSVGAA